MSLHSDIALSVILCTHNPNPDRMQQCIQGLKSQSLPLDQWEIVVVDNLSKTPVNSGYDFGWHPHSKVVVEPTLGLTPARLRGFNESQGEILVLVDDDNVLQSDYLERALAIARSKPFLGAWGGSCEAQFESPPPAWTERYWGCLAIREIVADRWSNEPRNVGTLPIGAGMCVRRCVATQYSKTIADGKRLIQLDRTGASLLSGGDQDLAACSTDVGLGAGVVTGLRLKHIIPPGRLEAGYLSKLMEGIAFSGTVLDFVYGIQPARDSLPRRVKEAVQLLRCPAPHRSILRATFRGRRKALQYIEENAAR